MRKGFIAGIAVVAAALIAVAVAAATGTFGGGSTPQTKASVPVPSSSERPVIVVKGMKPLMVAGSGFKAGERVKVGIDGRRASRRAVTAGAAGSFSVRLESNATCGSLTVEAIGNRGSRASFNMSSFVCR